MIRLLSAALAVGLAASGCVSTAGRQLDQRAARSGLEATAFEGGPFLLRAYRNVSAQRVAGLTWHIYLEGDGRPWIQGQYVAADPHGRNNIAFDLMLRDPAPSIYFQRPCYLPLRAGEPCRPNLWTHGRYSEPVVAALEQAIRSWIRDQGVERLVWIGYSGGGALARLLAPRIEETVGLVTVAANLDIDRWVELHGFDPLAGSLNPAEQVPLASHIEQIHWLGGRDENVPPSLVQAALTREPKARIEIVPDYDHRCCWVEAWPTLLREVP